MNKPHPKPTKPVAAKSPSQAIPENKTPREPGGSYDRSSGNTLRLRILLVDDHPIVRRGIVEILCEEFKDAVICEAENAQQALNQVWKHSWDVIILDVSLPGRSGLELLKDIKKDDSKTPVVVLSTHPEDQLAIRALKSGAASYLTKETAPTELVTAIRRVLSGGKYIRPSIAEQLATHVNVDAEKPLHNSLSDREFQVLCMISSGKTVKEIGAELSLSVKTISTYRCRILEKMMMKNNAELMHYAMQHDLVSMGRGLPGET